MHLHIWDSTLSVALCMHSFIRKCIIPTCTILLSTADSLGIKISVALYLNVMNPRKQFRPPAFLHLLLCYAQTAHHEGQFLSNCAFFFSIAQLILWHSTVRNLCSRLTWLTHQGHRRKSAAGTSDRSPGKLICRASVWWSLLVACSPLTVPLRWALSVGVPVLHLISCSLLWAVTFWSMAVAPCWQAVATTSSVFRAVRRPAARAASPHHVILHYYPPHPWSSWLAESSLQRMEQTQLPAS